MMQWFRLYNETLNDPKVQSLDGDTFKAWINLLCVANQCNASCNVSDVSFHLRCSPNEATNYINKLVSVGLFHNNEGILSPHNWNKRQYKSDTSTNRVKKFRNKKRNVSCNVSTPLHETPPEQNRTEHKQNIKTDFILPLPDWVPLDDWNDYLEMRNKKGKGKATNRAKQLVIIKLEELRKQGNDPSLVLRESIINNWTGVFALRKDNKPKIQDERETVHLRKI